MSKIINVCGRKACCPQILEQDGLYQIYDEKERWQTNFMTKEMIKKLGKTIDNI